MSNRDFYAEKKEWSIHKDNILKNYLTQYFPKVIQYSRGLVVVVDCFAGKGKFDDGSEGSPLIIARLAKEYKERFCVNNLCIFSDIKGIYCRELEENLKKYIEDGIAIVLNSKAEDLISQLVRLPDHYPLFLYLDPFGLKGLSLEVLSEIFKRSGPTSTEVLVNFRFNALMRIGDEQWVSDVMGGDWWKGRDLSNTEEEKFIVDGYVDLYKENFRYVGYCPILEKPKGKPKYYLIFGSRSYIAIELMNDVMHKEMQSFIINEYADDLPLFKDKLPVDQLIPKNMKKDTSRLKDKIAEFCAQQDGEFTRKDIKEKLIPDLFMQYSKSDYGRCVEDLIEEGKIETEQDKVKIDDKASLRWKG